MGARREVLSAVAETYWSGAAAGEGAHPRRVVLDDLASQAGVLATRPPGGSQDPRPASAQALLPRDDQRRADGIVGGVGSSMRQATRGDDLDRSASSGETRRLELREGEQAQLLAMSAATIDRIPGDVKIAAAGRLLLRDSS